jgi:rhomboid protease GluP
MDPGGREGLTFVERLRASPVTWSLAAINVAVFAANLWLGDALLAVGMVEPVHVWQGQYWRLFTYMFLHLGWLHLAWNTYASIGWCAAIERALGPRRFLTVYLSSGVAGGAASTVLLSNPSAGASGALFGIVGAALVVRRRELPSFAAAFSDRVTRNILINIALWTAIGFTALRMNHRAHFGGLATGVLVTWVFTSPDRARGWPPFTIGFLALLACATRPWTLVRGGGAPVTPSAEEARADALVGQCERGDRAACHAYALVMPAYAGDTTREMEPLCDLGDQDACAAYGWALLNGRPGVPREEARGTKMIVQACAKGSAWACAMKPGAPLPLPSSSARAPLPPH